MPNFAPIVPYGGYEYWGANSREINGSFVMATGCNANGRLADRMFADYKSFCDVRLEFAQSRGGRSENCQRQFFGDVWALIAG